MNFRIRRIEATASTNDDAVKAAEAGEAEGLVIHALKQTKGRGRHGRAWESPEGNLYCSVLLRPSCTVKDFGHYSFVAALALADIVREVAPQAAVTLKWPNDVLADGKKIGGILLESGDGFLVIGIGLNVLHHPENATYPSTSLYEQCVSNERGDVPLPLAGGVRGGPGVSHLSRVSDFEESLKHKSMRSRQTFGPPPSPPASGRGAHRAPFDIAHILQQLLGRLSHWYGIMQSEGFPPIRAAWLERAQKGPMTVKFPDQTVQGDFIDIDAQGHLRLRLPDGSERVLTTGDVFFT